VRAPAAGQTTALVILTLDHGKSERRSDVAQPFARRGAPEHQLALVSVRRAMGSRSQSTKSASESSPGGSMNLSANDDYTEERRLLTAEHYREVRRQRQAKQGGSIAGSSTDDDNEKPLPFTFQRLHEYRLAQLAAPATQEVLPTDDESYATRGTSMNAHPSDTTRDDSSETSTVPARVLLPEGVRAVHGLHFWTTLSPPRLIRRDWVPMSSAQGMRNIWPVRRQFVDEVLRGLHIGA
jgi:hypothetical protein